MNNIEIFVIITNYLGFLLIILLPIIFIHIGRHKFKNIGFVIPIFLSFVVCFFVSGSYIYWILEQDHILLDSYGWTNTGISSMNNVLQNDIEKVNKITSSWQGANHVGLVLTWIVIYFSYVIASSYYILKSNKNE